MTFHWVDFATVANNLLSLANGAVDEAKFRSAVSRAYYAAYHSLLHLGKARCSYSFDSARGRGYHKDLYEELKSQTNPSIAQLGQRGEALHRKRVQADYKNFPVWSIANTQLAIAEAQGILSDVQTLMAPLPPSATTTTP